MKKLYLINKIDFDSTENHSPLYKTCYGYISEITESEASDFVRKLNNIKGNKYKGYDDVWYPIFEIESVDNLPLGYCNISESKNDNKSYKILFRTIDELAKILTSLNLEDQFKIEESDDVRYSHVMKFKIGNECIYQGIYKVDPNGKERSVVVNELHNGDYYIYEEDE